MKGYRHVLFYLSRLVLYFTGLITEGFTRSSLFRQFLIFLVVGVVGEGKGA
jgi:hypothetical protein